MHAIIKCVGVFNLFRYNVDNMILAGIWCGRSKPLMNLFLKDFVEEVQQLSVEGVILYLVQWYTFNQAHFNCRNYSQV